MKKVVGIRFKVMDTSVDARAITDMEYVQNIKVAVNLLPVWFQQVETALNRFDSGSELSRINRGGGGTYQVSYVLAEAVYQGLQAAKVTNGIFDPTIISELEQAGYNCTFPDVLGRSKTEWTVPGNVETDAQVSIDQRCAGKSSVGSTENSTEGYLPGNCGEDSGRPLKCQGRYQKVGLERSKRLLTLPPGIGLDLGGIAKGWAVDQGFLRLQEVNCEAEICVNAGGDLRLRVPPGGKPWLINVENPFDQGKDFLSLHLSSGAVATSNVLKRRWQHKGRWQNHLIDPRTGSSCQSSVVAATVVGPTAVEAETWSKVLCILGVEKGLALLSKRTGYAAMVVLVDGEVILNEKMRGIIDGKSSREFSTCV